MRAILDRMKRTVSARLTAATLTIALAAPLTVAEVSAAELPQGFVSYLQDKGYSAEDINAVKDYLDTNAGQNYAKQLATNPNDKTVWSNITLFVQPGSGAADTDTDMLSLLENWLNEKSEQENGGVSEAGDIALSIVNSILDIGGAAGLNKVVNENTEVGDYLKGIGYQFSDYGDIITYAIKHPDVLAQLLALVKAGSEEIDPGEVLALIDELFTAVPPSAKPDPDSEIFVKIKEAMADYMGLITTGLGYTDAQVDEILLEMITPAGIKQARALWAQIDAKDYVGAAQSFSSEYPPENLGAFAITGIGVGILAILGLGFAAVQQFAPELLPF